MVATSIASLALSILIDVNSKTYMRSLLAFVSSYPGW